MKKQKIIENPKMAFWVAESIPTDHVVLESKKKIKILFDQSLKDVLSKQKSRLHPEQITQLVEDIESQMQHLHKHHITCVFFNIEDIVMINGSFFCIEDKHAQMIKNKHITINEVYKKSMFLPYELNHSSTIHLPLILPAANTYPYSLAVLALYCLFDISMKSHDDTMVVLNQIEGTELYWCLSRCLSMDQKERIILFI